MIHPQQSNVWWTHFLWDLLSKWLKTCSVVTSVIGRLNNLKYVSMARSSRAVHHLKCRLRRERKREREPWVKWEQHVDKNTSSQSHDLALNLFTTAPNQFYSGLFSSFLKSVFSEGDEVYPAYTEVQWVHSVADLFSFTNVTQEAATT